MITWKSVVSGIMQNSDYVGNKSKKNKKGDIMADLFESIKKELFEKIKFMDTTIKGVSDSPEYKDAQLYNRGIRTAVKILNDHKEELQKKPAVDLYLLKVKHTFDEEYEECGIFSSEDKMEEGKAQYLAAKAKDGFPTDQFTFTETVLKLNELY